MHDATYAAHVWLDINGNGQEDSNEMPFSGVIIQIVDRSNGLLWQRSMTDDAGNINAFSAGGKCGAYDIYLSVPEGYWPTTKVKINTPKCETANFGLRPYP
jgi:SdrD B-like domain